MVAGVPRGSAVHGRALINSGAACWGCCLLGAETRCGARCPWCTWWCTGGAEWSGCGPDAVTTMWVAPPLPPGRWAPRLRDLPPGPGTLKQSVSPGSPRRLPLQFSAFVSLRPHTAVLQLVTFWFPCLFLADSSTRLMVCVSFTEYLWQSCIQWRQWHDRLHVYSARDFVSLVLWYPIRWQKPATTVICLPFLDSWQKSESGKHENSVFVATNSRAQRLYDFMKG